jgi:hypothetical protein
MKTYVEITAGMKLSTKLTPYMMTVEETVPDLLTGHAVGAIRKS